MEESTDREAGNPGFCPGKDVVKRFLGFDRLFFPELVRPAFAVICAFIVLLSGMGVLYGLLLLLFGPFGLYLEWPRIFGLLAIPLSLAAGLTALILARIWFEALALGFRINENLEIIRDKRG
ncbi:MAG: DUF4282 domain-containing protein [Planctomycetota bacterium]|jgi:cytochrome b subunit of formate dehydrogenase|nr:DUF4282 domain-containing protein [Planctomycetota bacterium]